LHADRHPLVGGALINPGAVEQDLGYYAEAEELERQALVRELRFAEAEPHLSSGCAILVKQANPPVFTCKMPGRI
jgi:hypothetical protein